MVKPIPDGYHTLTPMFVFKDARKAIDFYKRAFGATEKFVMPGPDGKGVMHAELKIGDSTIMLGEERAECPNKSAQTLGGSPISLYLYVKDVDAAFRKALAAGGPRKCPCRTCSGETVWARWTIRSATPGVWRHISPTFRRTIWPAARKPPLPVRARRSRYEDAKNTGAVQFALRVPSRPRLRNNHSVIEEVYAVDEQSAEVGGDRCDDDAKCQ